MPTLAVLAARPTYRRHLSSVAPTPHGEDGAVTGVTAAQATQEARAHIARDPRNRRVRVAEYGAVTLLQDECAIRLEPVTDAMPKHLTAAQAEQLIDIATAADPARYAHEAGGITICSRWRRIPPAATSRLVRHGWVCEVGGDVVVSLAGLVALAWRHCKSSGALPVSGGGLIAESLVDVFTPELPEG